MTSLQTEQILLTLYVNAANAMPDEIAVYENKRNFGQRMGLGACYIERDSQTKGYIS